MDLALAMRIIYAAAMVKEGELFSEAMLSDLMLHPSEEYEAAHKKTQSLKQLVPEEDRFKNVLEARKFLDDYIKEMIKRVTPGSRLDGGFG
jgi:hypothetical protein